MRARLAATALVVVLPVAAVWALRAGGVVTSPWAAAGLTVALALLAAAAGSAYWARHAPGDVPFGDLLPWGWVRRRRAERQLADTVGLLEQIRTADSAKRRRLLRRVAAALDARDPYLGAHSHRVARYAVITARRMRLPAKEVARIRAAAAIQDVGKLHVPAAIRYNPGPLTGDEYRIVKRHATLGARMVEGLNDPGLTAIVRHHHERFDGRGDPAGLRGEEIPIGARVIAVVDTFDAITAGRTIRPTCTNARWLCSRRRLALNWTLPRSARSLATTGVGAGSRCGHSWPPPRRGAPARSTAPADASSAPCHGRRDAGARWPRAAMARGVRVHRLASVSRAPSARAGRG
jgi:hypothetical protein